MTETERKSSPSYFDSRLAIHLRNRDGSYTITDEQISTRTQEEKAALALEAFSAIDKINEPNDTKRSFKNSLLKAFQEQYGTESDTSKMLAEAATKSNLTQQRSSPSYFDSRLAIHLRNRDGSYTITDEQISTRTQEEKAALALEAFSAIDKINEPNDTKRSFKNSLLEAFREQYGTESDTFKTLAEAATKSSSQARSAKPTISKTDKIPSKEKTLKLPKINIKRMISAFCSAPTHLVGSIAKAAGFNKGKSSRNL